uniref:Peptidase S1 domain-containing protein n=1 Tax=Anopheles minimus TaxID=112268 RepID=A0A182VXJ8_9DIPT
MLGSKAVGFIIIFLLGLCLALCHGQTTKSISLQKCEEYRRVISSKRGVISLVLKPKPLYYETYNCSNVVELIVGGEAAKHGEFPHHALLGYPVEEGSSGQYSFSCGGSLISDRFILTAAHCFSFGDPVIVRLGEYDLTVDSTTQLDFGIAEIIRHPKYRNSRAYHDIALVRLNETVLFSKVIRPACLWQSPSLNVSRFVATGFGRQEEGSIELSTKMMKVQLDLFPSSDCAELFRDNRKFRDGIDEGQLCVGSITGGKDTCQGDSGGPLQTITEPKSCIYNIVGLTSTGSACGVGNSKAIYTKVAHYLEWIEQIVELRMIRLKLQYVVGLLLLLFCNINHECNEYRNIITTTHKIIHLLIDPEPLEVQVFNCTNELQLIVGGEQSRYGEFPHQALLGYPKTNDPTDYEFLCGGSLISEQHVLTAAHCFSDRDPTVVRLGEYDTTSTSYDELQLKVDRIRRHPRYPRNQPYDDIALIRLERPVQLSKHIRPACLWDSEYRTTAKFIASGFGRRDFFDTELSPTLMKVELEEFPREDCSRYFRRLHRGLLPGQLCVGSGSSDKDTCQGDSGGPLQLVTNETTCTYHIVGITSLGGACAYAKSFGIYTEVAHYLDWIEENCEEYKNIVIKRPVLIPLTLNPKPIEFEVYNCTNVVQLIVGGEQAKYGEFPHHALLGYPKERNPRDYDFLCGGTLISDQHVLTAAHCFSDQEPVIVRLGEYDTLAESDNEYNSEISSIRRHPNYKSGRSYDDIALVKLKYPVLLSKQIRPACLWETEERKFKRFIATGFGFNESFGHLSSVMMKVQLDEFNTDDCDRTFKGDRRVRNGLQDGQLCVGSIVQGRDTCQGDSGGPLQVVSNAKTCSYAVVGITSTGGFCGIGNSQAIYTKVSHYIDWIEDNVWGANAM